MALRHTSTSGEDSTSHIEGSARQPVENKYDTQSWPSLNTEDIDREAFMSARISPAIDYITIDIGNLKRIALPKFRYKRHGSRITIQDPSFQEILLFRKNRIERVEFTLDFWPSRNSPADMQEHARRAIYRHLSRGIWPFHNGRTVVPSYRVYSNKNGCHRPVAICPNENNDGYVEPRLPNHSETLYIGDRPDFKRFKNAAHGSDSGAQVRAYIKRNDNHQALPKNLWRTRIEVTLWDRGLSTIGITKVEDLFKISLRKKMTKYFNLIDLAKLSNSITLSTKLRTILGEKGANSLLDTKRRIIKATVREGGVLSLLPESSLQIRHSCGMTHRRASDTHKFKPTRSHADASANKKLGEALDNLTRKAKQEFHRSSQQ